jgi:hypothetical protein
MRFLLFLDHCGNRALKLLAGVGVQIDKTHREAVGATIEGFRMYGDPSYGRQINFESQPRSDTLFMKSENEAAAFAQVIDADRGVEPPDAIPVKWTRHANMATPTALIALEFVCHGPLMILAVPCTQFVTLSRMLAGIVTFDSRIR